MRALSAVNLHSEYGISNPRVLPGQRCDTCVVVVLSQAIKEGRNRFNFLGQDIRLIPSCAICVTMNPGYAGQTDTLQQ